MGNECLTQYRVNWHEAVPSLAIVQRFAIEALHRCGQISEAEKMGLFLRAKDKHLLTQLVAAELHIHGGEVAKALGCINGALEGHSRGLRNRVLSPTIHSRLLSNKGILLAIAG